MDFWKIYRNSEKIFLYERETNKVSFSMQHVPVDSYRFINSILKVKIDLMEIVAEGWQKISPKYNIYPINLAGYWTNKYLMFEDISNIAIVKTPQMLEILWEQISNTPIDELILLDYIEAVGIANGEDYNIRGDLNEGEIKLLNSIVHAFDNLFILIMDMLLLTSGIPWEKPEGWFLSGEKHTLLSVYGKWCFMDTDKFEKVLVS